MQLGKGSTPKPPTPSAFAQTPLGPIGKQIPGKAFSGSTESGARGSAQESSRSASSFLRLLENLLVLTGSLPVSSSPCSHLTHGMAFHPPVQETITLTLNLTNDHCHNSCLMALGFPFPVLWFPSISLGGWGLVFFFHRLTFLLGKLYVCLFV